MPVWHKVLMLRRGIVCALEVAARADGPCRLATEAGIRGTSAIRLIQGSGLVPVVADHGPTSTAAGGNTFPARSIRQDERDVGDLIREELPIGREGINRCGGGWVYEMHLGVPRGAVAS
jgi:hypothetical protein